MEFSKLKLNVIETEKKYRKEFEEISDVIFNSVFPVKEIEKEKDVVIAAFIQGATLTEKGAVTYWYNCRRKAKKSTKQD